MAAPRLASMARQLTLRPDGTLRLAVVADTHSQPHPQAAEYLAARAPDERHVRVPAHHGLRPVRARHRRDLRAQLGAVNADVNHEDPQQRLWVLGATHQVQRQQVRQVRRVDVDVAANRMHRSDTRKLVEHLEIPDVPRVQDGVRRACRQVLGRPRMRLRVGVRHHEQPQRPIGPESEPLRLRR